MVRAQEINERTEKCIVKVQSLVLVTEILPLQHLRTCEEQPALSFGRSHGIERDRLILQRMG